MIPQLHNPIDLRSLSFPPLPSPESPYLETPLSSTYQDHSWNPYKQSFGSLMATDSTDTDFEITKLPSTAYQKPYDSVAENQPTIELRSVALATIEYVPGSQTSAEFSSGCSPTFQSYATPPVAMQPDWTKSADSRRTSSRSARLSKRSKPQDTAGMPNAKNSMHQRLRSTPTVVAANSRPSTLSKSSQSSNSPLKHARLNHNQVEKQYRNRLNGQFETLLLVLPREDEDNGEEKKVSKAEVLILARKHIRDLEKGTKRLEEENERLEAMIGGLKERWVESGGVVLP